MTEQLTNKPYNDIIGIVKVDDLEINNLVNFFNYVEYRDTEIDGIKPSPMGWLWPKNDLGTWFIPQKEYIEHHKEWYITKPKQHKVAVQAGGACGMIPRLLSDYFERVYTFEPSPLSFFCLVNNCPKTNIIKMNAGLGASNELLEIALYVPDNVGMNKYLPVEGGFIPQMRIDDLKLDACDLIQLDIEGDEEIALYGAYNTIKKYKPIITIEHGDRESIEYFLKDFGYQKQLPVVSEDVLWFVA